MSYFSLQKLCKWTHQINSNIQYCLIIKRNTSITQYFIVSFRKILLISNVQMLIKNKSSELESILFFHNYI